MMVNDAAKRQRGYRILWIGQCEYRQRAREKMGLVIPAAIAIIVIPPYSNFRSVGETLIVMTSLPIAPLDGL